MSDNEYNSILYYFYLRPIKAVIGLFVMKLQILSLNVWGGALCDEVCDLVRKVATASAPGVPPKPLPTIFLFQEVMSDPYRHHKKNAREGLQPKMFERLQDALPNHKGFFASALSMDRVFEPEDDGTAKVTAGNAIFVPKNAFTNVDYSTHVIWGEVGIDGYRSKEERNENPSHRKMPHVSIQIREKLHESDRVHMSIFNIHGVHQPNSHKRDTTVRGVQSEKIREAILPFVQSEDLVLLMGDFNLRSNTAAMKSIEDVPMRNLNTPYGISSTRTTLYDRPGHKKSGDFTTEADYALVSERLNRRVVSYCTLGTEVSDHMALMLTVNV